MKIILSILLFLNIINVNAQQNLHKDSWSKITNPSLKGENGLLTINLPAPSALNFTVALEGDTKILYNWHSSTSKELAPGNYDISFWGIKIPSVSVEKGKESRIFAGVLNSTVKGLWEIWTMDSTKVFNAGGPKQVALPTGKYIVKTHGADIKTTIYDNRVSIFSFSSY